MLCKSCNQKRGRRNCPALGDTICHTCCGTKRQKTIDCPSSCPHLVTARDHPAASVRRQQERDLSVLMPSIQHLTERNRQLYFLFQTIILTHKPESIGGLTDVDVAAAAAAVAATLETAAKGVIYEHQPSSLPARRLSAALRAAIEDAKGQGATIYDGEAALVLRAISRGAEDTQRSGEFESPTAYVDLVRRLLSVPAATLEGAPGRAGSIIVP